MVCPDRKTKKEKGEFFVTEGQEKSKNKNNHAGMFNVHCLCIVFVYPLELN